MSWRDGTRLSTNHYKLLDHTGDVVADAFSTHTMVEDQIRIERVTSCTESSLTRHIAQREWVLYDADLVEQDRGTETREWELDIDLGRPLLKAY